MANGNGKKRRDYNSYTFRNRAVDRITGPTRDEKKAKRDSIMKVAKKNVEKKRGNARPDVVFREARRITMEDKIKNTPAGQRLARRREIAKAKLKRRKKN